MRAGLQESHRFADHKSRGQDSVRPALRGYQSQAQQPAPNKQQSKRRAAHYPGGRTLKDVHAERGAHLFRTSPRSLSLAFLCSLLSAAQQRLDGKHSHAVSGARWSESGGDKRARSVWLSGGSGGAMAAPAPALGSNLAPHPLVLKPAFGVTKPPHRLVSFQSRVRPPRRRFAMVDRNDPIAFDTSESPKGVGIHAMEVYFPRNAVNQTELEK